MLASAISRSPFMIFEDERTIYLSTADIPEPDIWYWIWYWAEMVVFAGILAAIWCAIGFALARNDRFRSNHSLAAFASLSLPAIWFVFLWRPFTFSASQSRWAALVETLEGGIGAGILLSMIFGWLGFWIVLRRLYPKPDPKIFE